VLQPEAVSAAMIDSATTRKTRARLIRA
jgi:hypothetical protein